MKSEYAAGRLHAALAASGMSLNALAKSVQHVCSYGSVYNYVHGDSEPSISFLEAVATVLNVSPGWLAFGEDAPRAPLSVMAERIRAVLSEFDATP